VRRWADEIAAAPGGAARRMVNRVIGPPPSQLHERHDASDFDTNRALPGPQDFPQIPALAERGVLRTQQFFEMLNAHLADRDFIATDRFSIADITAVVAVDFARVIKVRVTEAHPHLMRWRAAMAERPPMSL
jgi:glutathione S-transferase